MTEHQKILKMLESNPTCEKVLDEIDARIWCLENGCKFKRILNNKYPTISPNKFSYYRDGVIDYKIVTWGIKYTRSLDVLHDAIKKSGWSIVLINCIEGLFICSLKKPYKNSNEFLVDKIVFGEALEEFEKALCHAFVQTLEWRVENDTT